MGTTQAQDPLEITLRRVEPDGEISNYFRDHLTSELKGFIKGRKLIELPPPARPLNLPADSLMLVAQANTPCQAGEPQLLGSAVLIPLPVNGENTRHLTPSAKVGEIKRVVTMPAWMRKGVSSKLMAEIERLAREELGLELLVLETLGSMDWAQKFYESQGWQRRGVYGWYDERDSVCFEKWL